MMTEALIGLGGVVVGAVLTGVVSFFTTSTQWRREQLVILHEEIAQLHAAKWPGDLNMVELRSLMARIRVRMALLNRDHSMLAALDEALRKCRSSAERIPGDEVDVEDEWVWMGDSARIAEADALLDALVESARPERSWG